MKAEERVRRSAGAMRSTDAASKWLRSAFADIGEDRAAMQVAVDSRHLNGHGICHGGAIVALADSAFAIACNCRSALAVAQHNGISCPAPGRIGDRLEATTAETMDSGRGGVHDVRAVRMVQKETAAVFRGLVRLPPGAHFEEQAEGCA